MEDTSELEATELHERTEETEELVTKELPTELAEDSGGGLAQKFTPLHMPATQMSIVQLLPSLQSAALWHPVELWTLRTVELGLLLAWL